MILKKKKNSLWVRTYLRSRHGLRSLPGLVGREVATRKWRRDLVGLQKVSGLATWNFGQCELMSRHGWQQGRSRPRSGVATWYVLVG